MSTPRVPQSRCVCVLHMRQMHTHKRTRMSRMAMHRFCRACLHTCPHTCLRTCLRTCTLCLHKHVRTCMSRDMSMLTGHTSMLTRHISMLTRDMSMPQVLLPLCRDHLRDESRRANARTHARHGKARQGMARHGTASHRTAPHGTARQRSAERSARNSWPHTEVEWMAYGYVLNIDTNSMPWGFPSRLGHQAASVLAKTISQQ